MRGRGQAPQPRSGAPLAQDLTAIRMAAAQLAVLSGEASATNTRYVVAARRHRTCTPNRPQFSPRNLNFIDMAARL
jgi:hypothetical protein